MFFLCAYCRRPGHTHSEKRNAAGVDDDVRLEADVVMGKPVDLAAVDVVLVDADVVAATSTHTAKQSLHAPWTAFSPHVQRRRRCQ